LNAAWARAHRYEHLLYCTRQCFHPDSGERRSPQWCKLVVIADALARGYGSVLYLDSDAYWKSPQLDLVDGLVSPWAPEWGAEDSGVSGLPSRAVRNASLALARPPVVYFGCNSPWDKCGVTWNFSAPFAHGGSATTGLILLRNRRRTRLLLRHWWHARNGWARPYDIRKPGICSDQAVLWHLWNVRTDMTPSMRVLGRPSSGSGRTHCMHNAGTRRLQRKAPIEHLTSVSSRYRLKGFKAAWLKGRAAHDNAWCVTRVSIDAPAAASEYFGRVNASYGARGRWFSARSHLAPHARRSARTPNSRSESISNHWQRHAKP
jgi:hypothetical protein